MQSENFAVVVLSYNHPNLTLNAIKSLIPFFSAKQILLVHNGSELSLFHQLESTLVRLDFPINHLYLPQNLGYSGGMNAGLRFYQQSQLAFRWIFAITNDCELTKWDITEWPDIIGVIAPLILFRHGEKIDSFGSYLSQKHFNLLHYKKKSLELEGQNSDLAIIPEDNQNISYISGSAFLVHREIIEKNILMLESLHTYWEDFLWSQQIKKIGFNLYRTSEITLKHGGGKTTHKNPYYTFFLYQRNRLLVLSTFLNLPQKQIFILKWFYENLFRLVFVVKKNKSGYWVYFKQILRDYFSDKFNKGKIR